MYCEGLRSCIFELELQEDLLFLSLEGSFHAHARIFPFSTELGLVDHLYKRNHDIFNNFYRLIIAKED
jgi:hypothetical protein